MHRIIKNKTKVLQIAVVAVFMAVAAFAAKPAEARKFTLMGGYKYVSFGGETEFAKASGAKADALHGVKVHFLWSMGQRHDEDLARHLFGFGVGGGSGELNTFFDLSLNYEYIFSNGLGLSGGLGAIGVGAKEGNSAGGEAGGGVSDLGLRYHFKNGLALSTTVDLHSTPAGVSEFYSLLYGINVGLGYEF